MTNRMALVPVEASEEMVRAGIAGYPSERRAIYSAMLAAAPGSGKVTREKLREALTAAAIVSERDMAARQRARENALAAALGLEIVEG